MTLAEGQPLNNRCYAIAPPVAFAIDEYIDSAINISIADR
jgi:hypothetical protein